VTAVVQDVSTLAGPRTLPFLAAVEQRLAAQLADDPVGRASRETLAAGGKRLRPLLVLIAAPPEARERPELEIAACAAELVHMATLVHDDVLDAAVA
jgi:geranylgeranyl pyrophosphate synthase